MAKIFAEDTVEAETIKVIRESLGKDRFATFAERALEELLSHGCYKALMGMFEVYKDSIEREDPQ